MGECLQQKHNQHAPYTKTECDYFNGWIKTSHIFKNLIQNDEPQIYSWGHTKEEEDEDDQLGNKEEEDWGGKPFVANTVVFLQVFSSEQCRTTRPIPA